MSHWTGQQEEMWVSAVYIPFKKLIKLSQQFICEEVMSFIHLMNQFIFKMKPGKEFLNSLISAQ